MNSLPSDIICYLTTFLNYSDYASLLQTCKTIYAFDEKLSTYNICKREINLCSLKACCYAGHIHCVKHIIKKMSAGMQTKEKLIGEFYDDDAGVGGIIVYSSKKFHDVTNRWKTCAPQWAAESGQVEVIKYLVSLKLKLKHLRAMNNYAIRHGKKYLGVIKILTDPWLTPEGGLELKDLRCENNLILQWSIENDKLEILKYLRRFGITIKEISFCRRVLTMVIHNKDHKVLEYLMNSGLTIDQMKKIGVFSWVDNPEIPAHLLRLQNKKV